MTHFLNVPITREGFLLEIFLWICVRKYTNFNYGLTLEFSVKYLSRKAVYHADCKNLSNQLLIVTKSMNKARIYRDHFVRNIWE